MGIIAKRIFKNIIFRLPFGLRCRIISLYMLINGSSTVKKINVSIGGDVSLLHKLASSSQKDFMLFPVIDWDFRVQRPQHLVKQLSDMGYRVIYFTTQFTYSDRPGFNIIHNPEDNVLVISLNLNVRAINIYKDQLTDKHLEFLIHSVELARLSFNFGHTTSIVNLPFWRNIVEALPSNKVVYDCMDHHAGFENNNSKMVNEEIKLFYSSDLVITTASRLSEHVSSYRPNKIIRNAADVEYFSSTVKKERSENDRFIIGYYGAIAEWFDLKLLINAAKNFPECDFVIIGSITINTAEAENISNIIFLGEKPYQDLTHYLSDFDVCLIPFKLIELTLCTNPVKVYEYLAAGKPVVCTAMPELIAIKDVVHVSKDDSDFISKIRLALAEVGSHDLYEKRKSWAKQHSWKNRTLQLVSEIEKIKVPKVSIIVLTYNNLELTKLCLKSIELNTKYENYEVVVVDNLSLDGTRDYLTNNFKNKENFKIILNDENQGFAAGNNIGLKASEGDILVVLNNDTYVAPFWLGSLVNALKRHSDLGMVGPVTNNIGNESKININYGNWSEMNQVASTYTTKNHSKIYSLDCLAFFCVAIRREVYESVGGLCEEYGLGFFEDDDYCMRVKSKGWKLACAEDSFVHHHLSASFNKLKDNKKQELMDRNKAIFESKWGEWKPHKYCKGVF